LTNDSTKLRPYFKIITSTFSVICLTGAVLLGNAACSQKHDYPTASDIEDAESAGGNISVSDVNIRKCTLKTKKEMQQSYGKVMDVWQCQYHEVIHGQRGSMDFESNNLLGRDDDGKWHFLGISN